MTSIAQPTSTALRGLMAGLLALAAVTGVGAQTSFEVPAILSTYRANPLTAGSPAQTGLTLTANSGTVTLSARRVRELYYESFVTGYMQGEPDATYRQGYNANSTAAADGYSWLARTLGAKDRMPYMPIGVTTDPVTGHVHLYLAIQKLPTQEACQNVLTTMIRLGLVPGGTTGNPKAKDDPLATGCWRVLVHLPRGKGAPPAPTVFYPEAVGLIQATTTSANLTAWNPSTNTPLAVKQRFWDGFQVRYRNWYEYVSGAYLNVPVTTPALNTPGSGPQEPQPFFFNYPNLLDTAENPGTGVSRIATDATSGRDKVAQSGAGNLYFNAGAVWENRLLDPDAGLPAGTNPSPLAMGQNGASATTLKASQPVWQTEAKRPIELRIHAFANTANGGPNFIPFVDNQSVANPLEWYLHGVNTVGLSTDVGDTIGAPTATNPGQPRVSTNVLGGETRVGTNNLFGRAAQAILLDIDLNDPDGRPGSGDETKVIAPGVGMVELQFEYETYVPEASGLATAWSDDAATLATAAGYNPAGMPPTKATNPLTPAQMTYGVQAPGGGAGRLLDPLDPDQKQPDPPANGTLKRDKGFWRVRRYSPWPFNPAVAGVGDPGLAYQGGPIVCRFVVSPIQVVPQDQNAGSADNGTLVDLARYEPADPAHYRYPQLRAIPTAGGDADVIQRACFLLGYRGELGAVGDARPNEDYFFPLNPGASSPLHQFWIRVVQDNVPRGSTHLWTPAERCDNTSPFHTSGLNSGYPLAGPLDAAYNYTDRSAGHDVPRYNAFEDLASRLPAVATRPYAPLYNVSVFREGSQRRPDTGVPQDLYTGANRTRYDVSKLVDGDATATAVTVPAASTPSTDGYSVGQLFRPPVMVDRVDLYTAAVTSAAIWKLQWVRFTDIDAATGAMKWTDATVPLNMGGTNQWMWASLSGSGYLAGVRVVNISAADQGVCELRVTTRADVRQETVQAPRVGNQPDPSIAPGALSDAAVKIAALNSVDVSRPDPAGTISLTSSLRVDVPKYQPPSADAIQRQALVDAGSSPTSYPTVTRPTESTPGWDRYRGTGAIYLDESKSAAAMLPGANPRQAVRPKARRWDVGLYRLAYRNANYPAATQFVSWYEEDSGRVGGYSYTPPSGGAAVTTAQLETANAGDQHVFVPPYSTFDYEFSVGYDRRLSLAEKLVDLGKVIHGGISQWVPLTIVNEGNVPLRNVRLFLDFPLTPVTVSDSAALSAARLAQAQPVPSWFAQDLALQAGSEDSPSESSSAGGIGVIDVATPGSPQGRSAGDVFIRVGRLHATDPLQDRRVPVGQPIGNYIGRLRAFRDADGDGLVDTAERSSGGVATMKLTVQESPLWCVRDFWDNDINQRTRSTGPGLINNLMPYNSNTQIGTFQPIPVFGPMYTQLDAADATPTVAVIQDPAQMTATPPNAGDSLWVGWSSMRQFGSGANWGVYYRDAARPSFASGTPILQTNYRSFLWDPSLAAMRASNPSAAERNLYPNVCVIPGSTAASKQYLLLWHNEKASGAERASFLQFQRWQGGNNSGVLQIPDDSSGQSRINKQVPRAFVDTCTGRTVAFVAWQSGETGQTKLGFNAIWMPSSYNGPASDYKDAIYSPDSGGSVFMNYALRTPPGLTNVMDPWVLPTYRDPVSNVPSASNALRAINVIYSAWSPLWRNQDIYWSRYKPIEDPTGTAPLISLLDGLRLSPMAEDAYRLGTVAAYPGVTPAAPGYYVQTMPGGRLPFPRVKDELLQTNENHTVYAAGAVDWIMPPPNFRLSAPDGAGGWSVGKAVHKGFADRTKPLFDQDQYASLNSGTATPTLDPLVILRVYRAGSLNGAPLATTDSGFTYANVPVVGFDLANAQWDTSAEEWVLPITSPSWLTDLGVTMVRVQPGLGQVTFNRPLYRRGATNPIYVYATYRPCAWRVTSDPAADAQPTAAFDPWERMVIAWRRGDVNGRGRLWYRTFSLAVPLNKAPATRLRAVVNDAEDDAVFDGRVGGAVTSRSAVSHWSFVGAALTGGSQQEGTTAWSELAQNPTVQGFELKSGFGTATSASQGNAWAGRLGAGMVHFGYDDVGRRVRVWYTTAIPTLTNPVEEAQVVPGFGPERLVPLDGPVNESQPAMAAENYLVGYNLSSTVTEQIMSTRFWLTWISTRDLYTQATNPPRPGQGGAHVYYGTFLPDFSAVDTGP